jgi:hypothetical protein
MKKPLAEQLLEGTHYSTKVRQIDEAAGTRRIRMGINVSRKMVENLLNPEHPTPNPETEEDRKCLEECRDTLNDMSEKLKAVKTRRRVKK